MGVLQLILLVGTFCISCSEAQKRYKDAFQHSHPSQLPPIPGWSPDTNPWDSSLYPSFKSRELERRRGKSIIAHLTSDSPAMNGSYITFTTTLEFPKCQKEDANGNLVYDENCKDANGQVHSGYVYNWTSWLDDYGYGKCLDLGRCNVFPDGTPFPQTNDWRRRNYIYVWHTLGQYFQTCGGSSSSIKLNTTNITLGAEIMEVMVYLKRGRRKYSPTSSDSSVYYVTDQIPLTVNMSQRAVRNASKDVFVRDSDITFRVLIHDPSGYLKTAASVDFIWDFSDGNRLVTHSNVAAHAYSLTGNVTVKLIVAAAFRVACPLPTPVPTAFTTAKATTSASETPAVGSTTETPVTPGSTTSRPCHTTGTAAMTTGAPTTEPLGTTVAEATTGFNVTTVVPLLVTKAECFRYMYGNFQKNIFIVDAIPAEDDVRVSKIVQVSAGKVTNNTVNFVMKCLGSSPASVCTIISDHACRQVKHIACDDVPPSALCKVTLRRTFAEPGTYCVNITLQDSASRGTASIHVTIGNADNGENHLSLSPVSNKPQAAAVVLSASAVLLAIFAFIAFMVYRRYRVYQPLRHSTAEGNAVLQVGTHLERLRAGLLRGDEERRHLLRDAHTA